MYACLSFGYNNSGVITVLDTAMIELKNIQKSYPLGKERVTALSGIDLTVRHGEFLAITGASGSGKSTLMNILGFLDQPDSGTYRFAGENCSAYSQRKLAELRGKQIGFVFQGFHLLPHLTALQNVELPLIYNHIGHKKRLTLCKKALERVGLADRMDHKPNQLSGGQKQRVAIARAIALAPPLLLADEPTGNLDPHSGEEILQNLLQLNAEGTTVVMITHDRTLATRAGRQITITAGQISRTTDQ